MATHSSTLAWRIPWMEEPGQLQSMGSQRVWQDWSNFAHIHTPLQPAGWFWASHLTSLCPAAAAKMLQSCPTLCDPISGSPPGILDGIPVPGILQARTLEWVAVSISNAWKWKVKVKSLSPVQLPATPWTAAHQAPPSVGFSRQEYCSGVPLPSPSVHWLLPYLGSTDHLNSAHCLVWIYPGYVLNTVPAIQGINTLCRLSHVVCSTPA